MGDKISSGAQNMLELLTMCDSGENGKQTLSDIDRYIDILVTLGSLQFVIIG